MHAQDRPLCGSVRRCASRSLPLPATTTRSSRLYAHLGSPHPWVLPPSSSLPTLGEAAGARQFSMSIDLLASAALPVATGA
eukprot:4121955-Prymnesium_polylepis.1